jgi:CheY-like chemotaxis protein
MRVRDRKWIAQRALGGAICFQSSAKARIMKNQHRTVVVVDDEPSVLQLINDLLQDEGFRVVPLSHPEDATCAVSSEPGVFLLDVMLPGMSGIELARRLRQTRYPHTPMIAMSASRERLREAAEQGLFEDVVPKPFDVEDLLHTVRLFAA